MGRGPWSSPPPSRWDVGWQVHLWAALRTPSFSQAAAEEIARDLTLSQVNAVWAATRTFQCGPLTARQHASVALLRDELLRTVQADDITVYESWLDGLWRDSAPQVASPSPRRGWLRRALRPLLRRP